MTMSGHDSRVVRLFQNIFFHFEACIYHKYVGYALFSKHDDINWSSTDKNSACIIIHTPWSKGLFQLGYLVQAWGWDETALFNFTNYSYFK
jgi:hypothetical protein